MIHHLATDRLILRPLGPEDVDAHCAMMSDPEVARFLTPDGRAQPKDVAWRAFASILGHWSIRGFGFFSVIERSTGDWIGRVGPWMPEGWPGLEVGWTIARPWWGQGYAPESAIASVAWVFDNFPDLDRIISVIDPANTNSQAVARKIGEKKTDEIFRFHDLTLDIWAAPRDGWLDQFKKPS